MLVVILFIDFFGVRDIDGGASDLQNGETVSLHGITGMSWNELKSASPRVANLIGLKFRLMADKLPGYGTPVPIISESILSQVLPIIARENQW